MSTYIGKICGGGGVDQNEAENSNFLRNCIKSERESGDEVIRMRKVDVHTSLPFLWSLSNHQ